MTSSWETRVYAKIDPVLPEYDGLNHRRIKTVWVSYLKSCNKPIWHYITWSVLPLDLHCMGVRLFRWTFHFWSFLLSIYILNKPLRWTLSSILQCLIFNFVNFAWRLKRRMLPFILIEYVLRYTKYIWRNIRYFGSLASLSSIVALTGFFAHNTVKHIETETKSPGMIFSNASFCKTGSLLVPVMVLGALTHWGRVTDICVGNLTIIGSNSRKCISKCRPHNWQPPCLGLNVLSHNNEPMPLNCQ